MSMQATYDSFKAADLLIQRIEQPKARQKTQVCCGTAFQLAQKQLFVTRSTAKR